MKINKGKKDGLSVYFLKEEGICLRDPSATPSPRRNKESRKTTTPEDKGGSHHGTFKPYMMGMIGGMFS